MSEYERTIAILGRFDEYMKQSVLDFRISFDDPSSAAGRNAAYEDAMIDASNLAMDVEEKLRELVMIKSFLAQKWASIESVELARPTYGKYISDKARVSEARQKHSDLVAVLSQISAAVEIGYRAVDRLESLQRVSSRALNRQ